MGVAATLTKVIAACVKALDTEQRRVLAALAAFEPAPNTFSEAAAVEVARAKTADLEKLLALGLLQRDSESRLAIHPAVAEAVEGQPQAEVSSRFPEFFATYVQTHRDELSVLSHEMRNIVRAFQRGGHLQKKAIALALSRTLELQGSFSEWRELVEEAASSAPAPDPWLEVERARVNEKLGENRAAAIHARSGLEIAADSQLKAELLAILGHVEMNLGQLEEAYGHLREALSLSSLHPRALRSLGVVATRLAHYTEAAECIEEALRLARYQRDIAAEAVLLTDRGVLHYHQGRLEGAIADEERSLDLARQIGYAEKQAAALEAMAAARIGQGLLDLAESALREALEISQKIEHRWYIGTVLNQLGFLLHRSGRFDEAAEAFEEAQRSGPSDSPDISAYAQFGSAQVAIARGDAARAARDAVAARDAFAAMRHHANAEVSRWITDHGLSL